MWLLREVSPRSRAEPIRFRRIRPSAHQPLSTCLQLEGVFRLASLSPLWVVGRNSRRRTAWLRHQMETSPHGTSIWKFELKMAVSGILVCRGRD